MVYEPIEELKLKLDYLKKTVTQLEGELEEAKEYVTQYENAIIVLRGNQNDTN